MSKVSEFKKLHNKTKRLRASQGVKHHENYLDETYNGWGVARLFPYKAKAEAAYERMEQMESDAYEIYEGASESEQDEMIDYDKIFLTYC